MLVGVPQGVGGLAILFVCFYIILSYFSLFLQHAPGACRAAPKGRWPYYFIHFSLVYSYNAHQVLMLLALLFYYILYYINSL
jgi:hypothetical protein